MQLIGVTRPLQALSRDFCVSIRKNTPPIEFIYSLYCLHFYEDKTF